MICPLYDEIDQHGKRYLAATVALLRSRKAGLHQLADHRRLQPLQRNRGHPTQYIRVPNADELIVNKLEKKSTSD